MFESIVVGALVAVIYFVASISRTTSEQITLLRELISAAKTTPTPPPEPTWPLVVESKLDRILWKLGFDEAEYLAAKRTQAELAADAAFDSDNSFPAWLAHSKISGSPAEAKEYVEGLQKSLQKDAP